MPNKCVEHMHKYVLMTVIYSKTIVKNLLDPKYFWGPKSEDLYNIFFSKYFYGIMQLRA